MLALRKRTRSYHLDLVKRLNGRIVHVRGALGTHSKDAAVLMRNRVELALAEGAESAIWSELKDRLPDETYQRFADYVGVKDRHLPTWNDLLQGFTTFMDQQIKIGKLQDSTVTRYERTVEDFNTFLSERKITLLQDVNKPLVESFKVWRIEQIKKHKHSRGGGGLALDAAILHRCFSFAVENDMIVKNPVRMEGRPGDNPAGGAEPYSGEELTKLRDYAADDLLSFLLLRWTGFRGSDAVAVMFREFHFDRKEVEHVTRKRKKKVIVPLHPELLFALETEIERRKPKPNDLVLLNPKTGDPLTRPRLYERMLALGRRAGVPNCRPHRFRDTLAVDMLLRGGSPYDVAKVLGDTIETIEKHYSPFVPELRERVRAILESEGSLEDIAAERRKAAEKECVTPVSQRGQKLQ
jgi:integrase